MRPLNRPMFRYGGPIKEGIMDGIREPKKNGGPTGTGLVGDQRYPKTNGREHHALFIPPAIAAGAGLNALRIGAMRMAPRVISGIRNFFQTQKPAPYSTVRIGQSPGGKLLGLKPKVMRNVKDTVPKEQVGSIYQTRPYFANDPLFATGSKIYQGITSPTSKGIIQKGARLAISPSSIIAGVAYYMWPDGKERTTPPPNAGAGRQFTGDEAMVGDPRQPLPDAKLNKETGAGAEMSPEERRAKRVERYRDIMDIKGMNKKAAYDSLIEASRLINESGDFKGDIKSGRLINQIIGATSKAFDKPAQTKDAIDTLILKGEIEKDIKASDPSNEILNKLRAGQLQKINKELEGNTFAEAKAVMRKAGSKGQAEITDAAKSLEGVDYQGTIISKSDFKEVIDVAKNTAKQEGGTLSEEKVIEDFTTNFIVDKNVPDGEYVVGDAIISIKDGQVVPGSVRR